MENTDKTEGAPARARMSRRRIAIAILAAFGVLLAVYTVLRLAPIGERTITVRALDKESDIGKGTEIWIESVTVNGEEKAPEDVFSGTWITEDGLYGWRNYDQPEGMTGTLTATFPAGTDVDIRFHTNKWQGIVRIKDGYLIKNQYDVDCWSDSEEKDQTVSYLDKRMPLSVIRVLRVLLVYAVIWLAVVIIRDRLARRKQDRARTAPGASGTGA